VIGGVDGALLRTLLDDPHEAIRAWAIRLLTDDMPLDTIFSQQINVATDLPEDLRARFETLARDDRSGLVRLVLASTIQRLPVHQRIGLARALLSHAEDASDHNLPSLIWTALIPVAAADPHGLVKLAADCRLPGVVQMISRRLAEDIDTRPAPLNQLLVLATHRGDSFQAQVLSGLTRALTGRRKAARPEAWEAFHAQLAHCSDATLLNQARNLNVLFGDGRALDEVRRLALDSQADLETRKSALATLIEGRPPDLRSICERLVRVRFLNTIALRGLALFDDPAIGRALAENYRSFHASERPAVLETLVSRPSFAAALLDQVAAGKIPRADVNAFHARQIRGLGSPDLSRRLSEVWGELRTTPADRRERIATLKRQLDGPSLSKANLAAGRSVFERVCGSCHRLYGQGGDIGPDLTGSGRTDLDYLLENIVDPSAVVGADFRMTVVAMNDGRLLNGLIRGQTERTITLQTQTETLTLDRADVEDLRPSPLSLMPEGLLDSLNPAEVRDLIAYLMHPSQVPLAAKAR
jgi:putative heme-binding domain-containing protein